VVGNRDLLRLELAWAAASLVRWALMILVSLYAYRAGGAEAVGLAAVARIAPSALLAPRLALVADRRSRRAVLAVSMVVRLALMVAMTFAVAGTAPVWLVVALAAAWGVADSIHKPAQVALMAAVAHNPTELAAANGLWSVFDNGGFLVGSLAVGGLVAAWGLVPAFAVCSLPLAAATMALLGLRRDVALEAVEAQSAAPTSSPDSARSEPTRSCGR
jgi:MFS family permease